MMKNNTATKKLTVAALFMALNIALSSFGVPVPGGHFYLCDAAICTAAILLDPFYAFVWGASVPFWVIFSFIRRPCLSPW